MLTDVPSFTKRLRQFGNFTPSLRCQYTYESGRTGLFDSAITISQPEFKLAALNRFNAGLVMQSNMLLGTVSKRAKQCHEPHGRSGVEAIQPDQRTIGRT